MTTIEPRMKHLLKIGTRISRGPLSLLVLADLALAGCTFDQLRPEEDVGTAQQEIIIGNGVSLNGRSLNGRSLNGRSLNGRSLNGVSLNGMRLNGMRLNGISLNGSQLAAVTGDGQPIVGTGLVGAIFEGELSSGDDTLPLRIDSATALAEPNSDVWAYGVAVEVDEGWIPLCGTDDEGVPILAIPLAGTWNYESGVTGGGSWTASGSAFTLGCRRTALAKCVEFGYKPWLTVGGTPLRDHHQACTRMLRADYCGNGKSWTADGTPINIYDDLGIQSDEASWQVDAEWTGDGAVCTHHIRDFQPGSPSCIEDLDDPDCGDFAGGAVLIDEFGESDD